MALGIVSGRDDLKLPTIERMGGIGYLEYRLICACTIRVVERGINIGYRSTASLMRSFCGVWLAASATGICWR